VLNSLVLGVGPHYEFSYQVDIQYEFVLKHECSPLDIPVMLTPRSGDIDPS
jgi:hypothetical protein